MPQGFGFGWTAHIYAPFMWAMPMPNGFGEEQGAQGYGQQQQQQKRLSPEEFEAKKREYLTQKASLTSGEAERFFPLYNEMNHKLDDMRKRIGQQEREMGRGGKYSEEDYRQALERIYKANFDIARTEMSYYTRYKTILSNEKIYRIHAAEMEFHRDILKRMVR
jgi:hypothetical protein